MVIGFHIKIVGQQPDSMPTILMVLKGEPVKYNGLILTPGPLGYTNDVERNEVDIAVDNTCNPGHFYRVTRTDPYMKGVVVTLDGRSKDERVDADAMRIGLFEVHSKDQIEIKMFTLDGIMIDHFFVSLERC